MAEIPPMTAKDWENINLVLEHSPKGGTARGKNSASDDCEFSEYVLPRPKLHPVALHGILREMVDAACANTEAVPSTVAIHILARFAATLGRTAYIEIGDQQRHLRMNALIVGPTSKGRKGTSTEMPRKLFNLVQEKYLSQLPWLPLEELSALATGEGLIHRVRDAHSWTNGEKEHVDPGVFDKRLLCDVSEFAGVLAQGRREGATLSTVLRDAFDGVPLTAPSKTAFNKATATHIVVVGSVPETEIVKNLSDTDKTNGFANRFPMFYSAREQIVPTPKPTDPALMESFARHVAFALFEASLAGRIDMDEDARDFWEGALYAHIEERDYPAIVASLMARRNLYTLIFAALLALLNRKRIIGADELGAADAWMDYWAETALFVFTNSEVNEEAMKTKKLKDEIVAAVKALGGMKVSHTDLANRVTNKYSRRDVNARRVKEALELLQRESPPRIHSQVMTTVGRPQNLYTLADLFDASDEWHLGKWGKYPHRP